MTKISSEKYDEIVIPDSIDDLIEDKPESKGYTPMTISADGLERQYKSPFFRAINPFFRRADKSVKHIAKLLKENPQYKRILVVGSGTGALERLLFHELSKGQNKSIENMPEIISVEPCEEFFIEGEKQISEYFSKFFKDVSLGRENITGTKRYDFKVDFPSKRILTLKQKKIQELEKGDMYDLVVALGITYHERDNESFIREITKRVNPGGHMIFDIQVPLKQMPFVSSPSKTLNAYGWGLSSRMMPAMVGAGFPETVTDSFRSGNPTAYQDFILFNKEGYKTLGLDHVSKILQKEGFDTKTMRKKQILGQAYLISAKK